MKPNNQRISDWRIGIDPPRETALAEALLQVFTRFWNWAALDKKPKTTQRRYGDSIHALGGYLVQQTTSDKGMDMSAQQILEAYIDAYEGPLIHHDDEQWQAEIDMVCRKLYKYLSTMESKSL
jgi:hypothetical protein